jgi:hypothetical protein
MQIYVDNVSQEQLRLKLSTGRPDFDQKSRVIHSLSTELASGATMLLSGNAAMQYATVPERDRAFSVKKEHKNSPLIHGKIRPEF